LATDTPPAVPPYRMKLPAPPVPEHRMTGPAPPSERCALLSTRMETEELPQAPGSLTALVPLQSSSRTGLSPSRRDISADHLGQLMLFSHRHRKAISYSLFLLTLAVGEGLAVATSDQRRGQWSLSGGARSNLSIMPRGSVNRPSVTAFSNKRAQVMKSCAARWNLYSDTRDGPRASWMHPRERLRARP
jgi:hypothetical protein